MAKALRLTQVERKEISDAKMLEAAVDLIVERGAGQVTLKDVGEKAGYSRGLAGYRFGNREGLFDFVLRSVGDEWLGELTQVTANSFGYQAIAAALDAHIKFCEVQLHPPHRTALMPKRHQSSAAQHRVPAI